MLLLFAAAPAQAQGTPIEVSDCSSDRLDLAALRLRLDLELDESARASLADGERRVVIRRDCRSTEVTVRVEGIWSGFNLERVVDLGSARGAGRTWSLALVVGDLFERDRRSSRRFAEPEPEPELELDEDPPTSGFVSWRMERPFYLPALLPADGTPKPSRFHFGVASRLYFAEPTFLAGAYIGVQVDWVGLRLVGIGTSASNDQANLTGAMVLVEGALRAVELSDPLYRFGLYFTITGGLVHSETLSEEGADVSSGASIGAGVRAHLAAIFSEELEGDVSLTLGYDVGQAMSVGLADARGVYVGLDVGLRLPVD